MGKSFIACLIALIVSLITIALDKHQIAELKGELTLTTAQLAAAEQKAAQNWTVLTRVKSDFNSSLNACYTDYKRLSDSFDKYRVAVAKTGKAGETTAKNAAERPKTTCTIGGNNEIVNALNAAN